MKAKKVYEHIGFQRDKDITKSLGVGEWEKPFKDGDIIRVLENIYWYDNDAEWYLESELSTKYKSMSGGLQYEPGDELLAHLTEMTNGEQVYFRGNNYSVPLSWIKGETAGSGPRRDSFKILHKNVNEFQRGGDITTSLDVGKWKNMIDYDNLPKYGYYQIVTRDMDIAKLRINSPEFWFVQDWESRGSESIYDSPIWDLSELPSFLKRNDVFNMYEIYKDDEG